MESLCGQMGKSMMAIGQTMRLMDEESFSLRMVLFMMENGKIIKLKVMDNMKITKDINILASGKTTFKMDKEKKFQKMDLDMSVSLKVD